MSQHEAESDAKMDSLVLDVIKQDGLGLPEYSNDVTPYFSKTLCEAEINLREAKKYPYDINYYTSNTVILKYCIVRNLIFQVLNKNMDYIRAVTHAPKYTDYEMVDVIKYITTTRDQSITIGDFVIKFTCDENVYCKWTTYYGEFIREGDLSEFISAKEKSKLCYIDYVPLFRIRSTPIETLLI
jgi:hypothetical protein